MIVATDIIIYLCTFLLGLNFCSGLDVPRLLEGVGLSVGNIGTGVGVFGVAYVCHKVFMPVRIFITITCVPLVVKALRARGWLKGPQQTKPKAD